MKNKTTISLLTYSGALPFVLCAVFLIAGITEFKGITISTIASSYALTILSFVCGMHWGIAINKPNAAATLIITNTITLAGWVIVLLLSHWPYHLGMMAFLFMSVLILDTLQRNEGALPYWFWTLRVRITTIVAISLLIIIGLQA